MKNKTTKRTSASSLLREKAIAYIEIFAFFLTILLPLKFAALAALPEVTPLYPESLLEWLIVAWPSVLFPVVAGCLLLLTILLRPFPPGGNSLSFRFVALWTALAFCSIIGVINASTSIYASYQITHIFGIVAFAIAVFILTENNPSLKNWLLAGVILGAFMSCAEGVHQLLWSFDATQEFAYQQEIKSGVKFVTGNFKTRLSERRVFASFSLCNSFAAHLILVIPLCLYGVWRLAGKIDPPKVARAIFLPISAALLFAMLYYTKSRASFLAFAGAMAIFAMIMPFNKKLRIALLFIALASIAGGAIYVMHSQRGFLSMQVRGDYFKAAIKMFLEHPFLGTGWGDFFHEYMGIKEFVSDEAPHTPHNLILAFASQTGIAGLAFSCAALAYPLWAGFKKIRSIPFTRIPISANAAIVLGWTAWAIHSLSDVNIQIAGSVATALVMLIALGVREKKEETQPSSLKAKAFYYSLWYLSVALVILVSIYGGLWVLKGDYAYSRLQRLCDYRTQTKEEFMKTTSDDVHKQLNECIKLFPDSPFLWATAADFMLMKRKPFLAEEYYKEAVKRSPGRPSFYYRLYWLQTNLRKRVEAEKNLQKAKALFPNNPRYKRLQ